MGLMFIKVSWDQCSKKPLLHCKANTQLDLIGTTAEVDPKVHWNQKWRQICAYPWRRSPTDAVAKWPSNRLHINSPSYYKSVVHKVAGCWKHDPMLTSINGLELWS